MRVNPVSATGRAIVRRQRPSSGETRSGSEGDFAGYLPPPPEPEHRSEPETFFRDYHPNSVFLAHLLASGEIELQERPRRRSGPELCADAYRATAALPRQRAAGHLIRTDR